METWEILIRQHAENPDESVIEKAVIDAIMEAHGCTKSAAKTLKRQYMIAAYASADPFAARWWIRSRQIAGHGTAERSPAPA